MLFSCTLSSCTLSSHLPCPGACLPRITPPYRHHLHPSQFYSAVTRRVAVQPPPLAVFRGCPKPSMSDVHCKTGEPADAAVPAVLLLLPLELRPAPLPTSPAATHIATFANTFSSVQRRSTRRR